jgi:hypothetical protein
MKAMKKIILMLAMFGLTGIVEAQHTFTKVYYDSLNGVRTQVYSFTKTYDNNYILAGIKDYATFAMKIDTAGNILWAKKIQSGGDFKSITNINDSCVLIVGKSGPNMICMKMDYNGDTIWTKAFHLSPYDNGMTVQRTNDNCYVIGGSSYYFSTANDNAAVIKIDSTGNIL